MKQKLYLITTKKELFHIAAYSIQNTVIQAEAYINNSTAIGVEPEQITDIKYVGYLIVHID